MDQISFCSRCGQENGPGAGFCFKCGAQMGGGALAPLAMPAEIVVIHQPPPLPALRSGRGQRRRRFYGAEPKVRHVWGVLSLACALIGAFLLLGIVLGPLAILLGIVAISQRGYILGTLGIVAGLWVTTAMALRIESMQYRTFWVHWQIYGQ